MIFISVLVFILILSVLVVLHEFGHFLMAKRSGIGVEEFGIGFPPRIWGKKIGETIYSVNWMPFGGFVKLVGEDSTDKKRDAKNSFFVKSIWARSRVVLAGVFMNLLIGVLIYYALIVVSNFQFNFTLPSEHRFFGVNQKTEVLVADVTDQSPARSAGVNPGDFILGVGGRQIGSIKDLQEIVRASDNKPLAIKLEDYNHKSSREVTITPKFSSEINAPALGVGLGELTVLSFDTLPQKLFSGFIHSYNMIEYSGTMFVHLVSTAITSHNIRPLSDNVSGPIGIAYMTNAAVRDGYTSVLNLMALLSLNLGVLNLLPIPALDGGRFFFILVEGVTRKKVYPSLEKWVHTVGFAVLVGLIILISYNDIVKIIHKQFPF